MRYVFLTGLAVPLLLSSCAERHIAPEEVLRRTAVASQEMRSARFEVQGEVTMGTGSGWAFAAGSGVLQDGGRASRFALHLQSLSVVQNGTDVDVILLGPCDVFLRPTVIGAGAELIGFPRDASGALLNRWWRTGCAGSAPSLFLTPDAGLLRLQVRALRVEEDRGIEVSEGGPAYHFVVSLDQDRLQNFLSAAEGGTAADAFSLRSSLDQYAITGEVWIDRDTFVLQRLSWSLQPKRVARDASALHFAVRLWDHGTAERIAPPVSAERLQFPLAPAAETGVPSFLLSPRDGSSP